MELIITICLIIIVLLLLAFVIEFGKLKSRVMSLETGRELLKAEVLNRINRFEKIILDSILKTKGK